MFSVNKKADGAKAVNSRMGVRKVSGVKHEVKFVLASHR